MIYTTPSQLKERHNSIMSSYKNTIPFYKRGSFFCLMRIVIFIAWCIVWLESGNRYLNLDYVYYDTADARLLIIPMLLCTIGLFVIKPYKIFTTYTFYGKIEKIEKQSAELVTKDKQGKKVVIKRMHMVMYDGYNIITVKKKGGKRTKKIKVPNLATFDRLYDLDSSVSVINGVRFPVPMNKNVVPSGMCLCTKCGSFEKNTRTRCSMCFTTLWYK